MKSKENRKRRMTFIASGILALLAAGLVGCSTVPTGQWQSDYERPPGSAKGGGADLMRRN